MSLAHRTNNLDEIVKSNNGSFVCDECPPLKPARFNK